MDCLGRGFRDKEVATHLGISLFTVRSHLRRAMLKAGAKTRSHLLTIAVAGGFELGPDFDGQPEKDTSATVPPKLRFEVLMRDQFRCQYCGARAPDVVLHVDHKKPAAAGGETVLDNLVTSCERCNFGKGKVLLPTFGEQT